MKESPTIAAAAEESRLKAENGGIPPLRLKYCPNCPLDNYYQIWTPTIEHRFPFNLPVPPDGYIELRNDWAKLRSSDDELYNQYLLKLSIESHRLDTTFQLTEKVSPLFSNILCVENRN